MVLNPVRMFISDRDFGELPKLQVGLEKQMTLSLPLCTYSLYFLT